MSDAALAMDRIYGWQTGLYDATRRWYLLGRDRLIEELAPPAGARMLEIGCGTGRNLIRAAQRWPAARLHGLDVSSVMLDKARAGVAKRAMTGRIRLALADATDFDPQRLFDEQQFERIYFSYTLSMIPEWRLALERAAAMLAPGGALLVADFGDQRRLPRWFRAALRAWLALFHVTPRDDFEIELRDIAAARGLDCEFVSVYRGYAFLAALRRPLDRARA